MKKLISKIVFALLCIMNNGNVLGGSGGQELPAIGHRGIFIEQDQLVEALKKLSRADLLKTIKIMLHNTVTIRQLELDTAEQNKMDESPLQFETDHRQSSAWESIITELATLMQELNIQNGKEIIERAKRQSSKWEAVSYVWYYNTLLVSALKVATKLEPSEEYAEPSNR